MSVQADYAFKLVVVGDAEVGKTNLIKRLKCNEFDPNYVSTFVDHIGCYINVDKYIIKLNLCDISGSNTSFNATMMQSIYDKVDGILLVFDITNRKSFDNIQNKWTKQIKQYATTTKYFDELILLLVGNKCDLTNEKKVSYDEINKEYNMQFIETSAKDSVNVESAFVMISKQILQETYNGWCKCQFLVYGYLRELRQQKEMIIPQSIWKIFFQFWNCRHNKNSIKSFNKSDKATITETSVKKKNCIIL
eukprot:92707_1